MTDVAIRWVKDNVSRLDCAGGQITLKNFEEFIDGNTKTVQTTLTRKGILAVENG